MNLLKAHNLHVCLTRRMAIANWTCVSWVAYAPGAWDHRGKCYMDRKRIQCLSNASQHVPIYLQPFLRYSGISVATDWFSTVLVSEWTFFNQILLSPGYAPGTIAVNVTWIEREFNACQTHHSMYPFIFNRFPVIQAVSLKVRYFSTFWPPLGSPLGQSR